MLIDGKLIAQSIYDELQERTAKLKEKGITPTLAVLLVGEDSASHTYVGQKQQKVESIGAHMELSEYPADTTTDMLLQKVRELNANTSIHGIIIQRPLPTQISTDVIQEAVDDAKDIDGFKPGSPFHVPLVMAVVRILHNIYVLECHPELVSGSPEHGNQMLNQVQHDNDLNSWLKSKNIVILGKGSTAGQPLIDYLREIGVTPQVIDSKTERPEELTKNADIIISSVGKQRVIRPDMIKKGLILISVGLSKDNEGKLHSDYEEEEIADIASYYTATPGGVGPVNVAMLLYNLVTAAEQKIA